jgi:Zn-dependent protease with chaperone function/tetratricopeptide (TPR) repeat protein
MPELDGPLVVTGVFAVMAVIFFFLGLRQRSEAGGTWRRLFWVSLALAALQTAPVFVALLLTRWLPGLYYVPDLAFVTFVVFAVNMGWHGSYLVAVTWEQSVADPRLLKETAVLDRVVQIAASLGIAPPPTRLVRTLWSLQPNQAYVTGLAAPTMVLYEGILHRLTEEERDAIIAHELAHLATHTFWYRLVAGALCSVVVVVTAAFLPILVVLGLSVALWTGTWLILSRRLELDCDRRAARAIGHRRTASALWKIHADDPLSGPFEFLISAVSTHPSRDERLAAVYRDAPKDDKPDIEWNPRLLAYRRLAARCAVGLWLSVIAGCLVWGYHSPRSIWPALPLALTDLALFVLSWLGLRKAVRRQQSLVRTRRTWWRRLAWLVPMVLVGLMVAQGFRLTRSYLDLRGHYELLVGAWVVWYLFAPILMRDRANELNDQVRLAMQSGDYARTLALAEGSPALVARSNKLRYNSALVRAVLGQRDEALAGLEQLHRDEPGFKLTALLLICLYTDEGNYARALELATQLSHELPGEPAGPEAESWLLRKVGRLEEAETCAREVLSMEPCSDQAHLTLAAVALDRGDHAGAREQLARAERLVPGSVTAALLAAEVALATEDGAEAAVYQALHAARNNPLSFVEKQAARLAQRLEARQASPGSSPPGYGAS